MPAAPLSIVLVFAGCLTLGAADAARAQDPLAIRAVRRDTIVASSTVTAAFTVVNRSGDSVLVTPRVEAPKDWTVLMGGLELVVPPSSSEMVMASVVVPVKTIAGVYALRVWVSCPEDRLGTMDSVFVLVPPRRGLEVGVADRPSFVVSGKSYDAGFLVRNRGNQAAVVRIHARSSSGSVAVPDTTLALSADESRLLRMRVRTPAGLDAARDDIIEVVARSGDSTTEASARVTIVPEPSRKIEEYLRVPTRVNLRAASSDGVSPFEVFGRGIVRDGSRIQADFLLRGPTGRFAAFGERDEYRFDLTAPDWRIRLGDQFFMLTPLTGSGQPGAGAGADATRGAFSFGGYGQQFRKSPGKENEAGAFVTARPIEDGSVSLNVVTRTGGARPAQIGSVSAAYDRGSYRAETELARSDARSAGTAGSVRFSSSGSGYAIDAGHHFADTGFAGVARGSSRDHINASARPFELVSFSLNAGSHRSDLSRATGVPYTERFDLGGLAATFAERVTVELTGVSRSVTVANVRMTGQQRGVRTRADQSTILGHLSAEAEAGRSRDGTAAPRGYTHFSLGARHSFGRGTLGTWGERYSGGSLTQGSEGTVTLGADASLRANRLTNVTVSGYATRHRVVGAEWHTQLDALVTRSLPNGRTISLRARVLAGGAYQAAEQSVAYLEYGVPLRLPISRLRTPGRVYGRVVDSETGTGVPGALVRLGPQVAITDGEGKVAFGGVRGGEHRLSMSQETSFADAVFVGDPTLMVDSAQSQPTTFRLAIARSARLEVDVRRFAIERTGVAGAPDSLADAGSVENATLVLAGERDTLYRTTAVNGKALFTDVPPGHWTITVRGDAPAFHRFDPDRLELKLAPGESQALTFRLVPRRRDVQLIGESQELKPTLAEPKTNQPKSDVKTPRPQDKQKQDRKDRQDQ